MKVTYEVYAQDVSHGGIVNAGAKDATKWIKGRFEVAAARSGSGAKNGVET